MSERPILRALTLAATVLVLCLSAAPRASAETLADVLVAAYRNSNLLEQNRALLRASDEDVIQAQGRLLPVVRFITGASATHSTVTGTTQRLTFSLSADFPLIDFGRGALAVEISREQMLAARAGLIGVEQAVLLRAIQAYLNVTSTRDTVALRRNNLELIRQELRAARERFELGDSTRTDVAIAEARLAAAQSLLSAAEGDFAVAREEFNLAVGRYPNALATAPQLPRLPVSLSAAQATARASHPAILQAQHQVRIGDLALESARTERLGSVSGQISAGHVETGGGPASEIGASMTWSVPLYSGGRLNSAERQAVARAEAQRAALHQTVAQVQQSVADSWSRIAVARARLEAGELQIRAASTAYEAVRAEAELGARTTLDVLNAEQELLDAQSNRIAARAALQLASYALLEATGQLTVQALNLGIPTYDVEAYVTGLRPGQRGEVRPSEQGQRLDRILGRMGGN